MIGSNATRDETVLLLEAVSFSARAHRHQLRKDRDTPYAAHPMRVCLVVRHVFGIEQIGVLIAALLHDAIEDTPTDFDDIAERFGTEVAGWVAALTKDMRLPEAEREAAYFATLATAEWPVQVAKLADIFDNLHDSASLSVEQRRKTVLRSREYLAVLKGGLKPEAARAFELTEAKLDEVEAALTRSA